MSIKRTNGKSQQHNLHLGRYLSEVEKTLRLRR